MVVGVLLASEMIRTPPEHLREWLALGLYPLGPDCLYRAASETLSWRTWRLGRGYCRDAGQGTRVADRRDLSAWSRVLLSPRAKRLCEQGLRQDDRTDGDEDA